ncbi:conserved hypothetical protein [Shewanella denitrificans OS217]|uniref:ATP-grasp domain-containing protein n=1 Tax=Shewanella denitrificans (strain OS217 / ATCC BAA-1090 / DSM 15013) TaxID=318161 RepID=Q12II4_SHEDO|nr:ATP-grasp domain-containing protein [Shewanella denitrificans]ABE56742.1 conserved hypothetical protein [Shewanella denitrificans OS217]
MSKTLSILVLHRVPFENVGYDQVIDHDLHQVTYLGLASPMSKLPKDLPCHKVVIEQLDLLVDSAVALTQEQGIEFDYIIGVSEYQLFDAALIRERLNIQGPKPHDVLRVRDKLVMKHQVQAAGLHVPRFFELAEVMTQELTGLQQLILKPKDGASSENVIKYADLEALRSAITSSATGIPVLDNDKNFKNFEVEEFVEGPILHLDGIVQGGVIDTFVASTYEGTCLAFAEGEALGSYQIQTEPRLMDWAQAVITALAIDSGAFHLEVIESGERLVFLEIGHRAGGANVVRTFELRTGINLHHANLATQLRLPIHRQEVNTHKSYGWFVFPGHHYDWDKCRLEGHEDIKIHHQMFEWNQLSNEQPLTKHITYQKKEVPAAGIIQGDDSIQVQNFMQRVLQYIQVQEAV